MVRHFEDQEPLMHVLQKRIEGKLSVEQAHGTEMPGRLAAGADAAKETAIVLLLLWLLLNNSMLDQRTLLAVFFAFAVGWIVWKIGRSGWLGWSRLERLHRLIEQEKYEIEHHRPHEREELLALYTAKGFQGKLLDDVVDVLMADQDRLLKVMLEEEMGLVLNAYEHPLQQALGAALGSIGASLVLGLSLLFLPSYVLFLSTAAILTAASLLSARYEGNRLIAALVWTLSIGGLAVAVSYFLLL